MRRMRVLVIADVHANLAALTAVIEAAGALGGFDKIWCLGDVVGYGAEPAECIDLLNSYENVTIAGNHDLAAAGIIGIEDFNPLAAAAITWTKAQLNEEHATWLRGLPQTHVEADFTLVHGSLRDPVWDYLLSPSLAEVNFRRQSTPYCLVGHSHMPVAFRDGEGPIEGVVLGDGTSFDLDGSTFVANPGSVGQPRDGDKRSSYGLLDLAARRLEFHRTEYDVAASQARMRTAGLPGHLIERLERGR
jgi:diadenosine tetraphosphatase ApaH/serine/threonine PP2A family protein phosphatase